MTVTETLLETANTLPKVRQQELLDFAQFLKQKENENHDLIKQDLAAFEESELQHLEMEFENYEQRYPRR